VSESGKTGEHPGEAVIASVSEAIQWRGGWRVVRAAGGDTLAEDGAFALPEKKKLKRKSDPVRHIVAGFTESPVNRPKNGQKEYYSGKKRHTLKTQVIIERNSPQIIDAREAKGGEHDFKVFKDTVGKGVSNSIPAGADSGYQGIKEYMRTVTYR
jgi:hypothetical protein